MTAFSPRDPIKQPLKSPRWMALFFFGFVIAAAYYGALLWMLVWLGGKALGPLIG